MGREVDMEKEFSENIDRILAGQEVKVSADIDDDYRTALDLAQKLIRLRAVPSPSFKAQLKERLLLKLSEEETRVKTTEVKRNWFWEALGRLVPRQPVWQGVTITLLVAVVAGGVIWGSGILVQTPAPPPLPTPAPGPAKPPLEVGATTDKGSYLPGEDIKVAFSFKNVSSSPVQIEPFPPAVEIMRPEPYEPLRSFSAGTGTRSLNPGEAAIYTVTWDQLDNQQKQVDYGYYYVELRDIQVGGFHMKPSFGMTAPILILPAEGAMEKTIEVNQSQTVNDITITLERVELSVTGARFYAFTIPPGYSPPEPLGPALPPPPPDMVPVHAEYTVDSVTKDAGWSGIGVQAEGLRLTWGSEVAPLDPVPSDAKELIFTITRFGDMEGPWEFFIPLEP